MSKRTSPGHRSGWCIHYTAPPRLVDKDQTWKCDAGVDMEATWHGAKFDERPCFLDKKGRPKPGCKPCEHLRCPTPEEIAADEAWTTERINRLGSVMVGISGWRKRHQGKSHAEVVECPACKGRLHLSISSYNGHVHGKCETADCVSWME